MNRAALILLLLLLLAAAAAHLLLPLGALADARAIDPRLPGLLLTELRLPRTSLVIGYGAVLGLSGAALQAVFANPLASPDISGASSGAALGAVLGLYWLAIADPLLLAGRSAGGEERPARWSCSPAFSCWPGGGPNRVRYCWPGSRCRSPRVPPPASP